MNRSVMYRIIVGGGLVLTLALALSVADSFTPEAALIVEAGETPDARAPDSSAPHVAPQPDSASRVGRPRHHVQASVSETDFRPPSLAGTAEDGQLELDTAGRLKRSLALRDRLDYWLSALHELPESDIRLRLEEEARRLGGERAAEDMRQLLDAYLAYLRAADSVPAAPLNAGQSPSEALQALETSFEALQALRIDYLGEETAQAFFGEEEAYGRYTLDVLRAESDRALSTSERAQRKQVALAQLPDKMRARIQAQAQEENRLEQGLEAMQAAHNTDELDRQLAEAGYTPAQRQTAIAAWQLEREFDAAYARYREAIRQTSGPGLSATDQQAALEQLRQTYFDSPQLREWARLRDRINQG
ncbi:MAG: hypothetical protein D6758_13330 [Gammaproteobacteria bacterium]|nr:MAG: hypothetical protein D6758_13330 [Gammaproteobacteria bacterium]